MSKETLKKWRLLIPGIIIILFIIPGLTNSKEELFAIDKIVKALKWTDSFYLALVIILGAIYYSLNLRWVVWKPFNSQVQENIKDKILNASSLKISAENWYKIKRGRAIITIFYDFVDNNESLKDKSKGVRFNGLIWSSFIDLTILSLVAGFVYSVLLVFTSKEHYVYLALLLFCLCFVSLAFSWLLTYKHKSMSNEQIEVILQTKRNEIDTKIQEAIDSI
jgi:hypothetical protein